jgi:hypothetical protein
LRSGRDGPEPVGLGLVLEGREVVALWVLPKKSRPSSESAGLCCLLDDSGAFGGARRPGGSVVLGLTGGEGVSSAKMSNVWACCRRGAG